LVTDEVIGYLNTININSRLLTDDDPLKDEYTKFLSDLGNSPIIISNADIDIGESDGYFDDIDLSSTMSVETENLVINKDFYVSNRLWANGLFSSTIMPPATYVSPIQCETRKFKALGMSLEFIPQNFNYEPSVLSGMVDLSLAK
jgi:hypothetical protein